MEAAIVVNRENPPSTAIKPAINNDRSMIEPAINSGIMPKSAATMHPAVPKKVKKFPRHHGIVYPEYYRRDDVSSPDSDNRQ
jgi:hypothetical protein